MKTAFPVKLYLALPEGENLFFSPFSIRSALGRAAVGARGNTRQEMLEALDLLDGSDAELMSQIAKFEGVHNLPEVTVEVANRIYAEITYRFRQEFLELMEQFAGIEMVNFQTAFEEVRAAINNWVAEMTHDRIKNLLSEGSLDALTRMVLVNAIYFKGNWKYQFDPEDTEEMDFHLESGRTVLVDMMYQQNTFLYGEDDAMQVLIMPYEGDRLARLVLLPKEGVSLRSVEEMIAERGVADIVAGLHRKEDLHVYVPKFEMGWGTFDITQPLKAMGIKQAFADADFSGMTEDQKRDLYISGVYHKAWVKDDEEGSEAAAATAVVMRSFSISIEPEPVFRADRPFVFMIVDMMANNNPLFMGRMWDPSK